MSEQITPLEELISELPPDDIREIRIFAEFLVSKRRGRQPAKPTFEWAGALRDLRGHYSSVELQHEISRLRSEIR